MINKRISKIAGTIIIASFFFLTTDSFTREIPYKLLKIEDISRYNEDRIAYQHIQLDVPENVISTTDNSLACLLIIVQRKMYLLKDGYDNPEMVRTKERIFQTENRLISNDDLWINKIDSKPDFIRITERRIEILKKVDATTEESKDSRKKSDTPGKSGTVKSEKDFVSKNFQKLYLNIRNEFLKKHARIFRQLMIDRSKSGLFVERKPLPKALYVGATDVPTRYYTRVTAKTTDEKLYYAEDADGDGVTETFTVHCPDGFFWGFKSGPNIIFIYKNKEKDIEDIIGPLTDNAYFGTDEEANTIKDSIKRSFPKEDDPQKVKEWVDKLVPTIEEEAETKK